ncbi:MAG: PRTRC system protein D [Burkholderiales bacterium]
MPLTIRAVDVGFGNTKFVTSSASGKIETSHFRSLAFFSASEKAADTLGGKRRTVSVPVDSVFYEVGPEVELAAHRYRSRPLHDGYTETAEYRALLAGALHYMKADVVDLLVVGLPVAQYLSKRAAVEKATTRSFDVGKGRRVSVRRVLVVAQPQGALFEYAQSADDARVVQGARNLVIDVGSRTFDWLVTSGLKVVGRMSNSVARGVSDILIEIADRIGNEIGEEFTDLEAVDEALRTTHKLRIYQKEHDLRRYEGVIKAVTDQAVDALMQRMDSTYNVENIVLVGGGAYLFKKAIKRRFPRHKIVEVAQPLYANVRGFQLMGEQYAVEHPELFCAGAPATEPSRAETT